MIPASKELEEFLNTCESGLVGHAPAVLAGLSPEVVEVAAKAKSVDGWLQQPFALMVDLVGDEGVNEKS